MIKKALIAVFLFSGLVYGEMQTIPGFKGLHNRDAAVLIGDSEAQDLSNVDILDSGLGIKKRSGYSSFNTFGVSTIGVRGAYFFRDASGNDNKIVSHNRSIYYQRSGGSYTAFITTDTAGNYPDFTDSNGYLYRLNSERDEFARWDGTTLTYYPSNPKGNQIEALSDRLVVSGVAANPNRVYFSAAADFTTFTTGNTEDSAFTEDVGLPGQSNTALKAACGGVLIFSKDSLSIWVGNNQFDGSISLIDSSIGTLQPHTVITDNGVVFWHAQDNNWYSYDCNTITMISRKIDPSAFIGFSGDVSLSFTSQADFEAGSVGTGLSTTDAPGNVQISNAVLDAFTDLDTTSSPAWTATAADGVTYTAATGKLVWTDATPASSGYGYAYTTNPSTVSGYWETTLDSLPDGHRAFIAISNSATPANAQTSSYNVSVQTGGGLLTLGLFENTTLMNGAYVQITDPGEPYTFGISRTTSNVVEAYVNSVFISSATDSSYTSFPSLVIGVATSGGVAGSITMDDIEYRIVPSTYVSEARTTTDITSFLTFDVTETLDSGTIAYAVYTDTDTNITITDASTFTSSQTITNGSVITATTSTYVRWAAFFSWTEMGQEPSVASVTIGYETGSDARTNGFVDADHRLLWTVVEQGETLPSATYIYDQRFGEWTKYSVPMVSAINIQGTVYFGSTSEGEVFRFPSGADDDGAAITAYWKSKDFIGQSPFEEKDYISYSLLASQESGSNLDVTYSINAYSSTTNNFSLTDPLSLPYRRINAKMPSGKYGTLINYKFGNDDANAPFEIYGFKYDYRPRPWRVLQ